MALNTRHGFKPDHKSFGAFLMSPQALDPVQKAAKDVAELAGAAEHALDASGGRTQDIRDEGDQPYADNFRTEEGEVMTFDGNPRRTMRVFNNKRFAAVREFGYAPGHKGGTRSLRRAGSKVGQLSFNGDIGGQEP